MTDSMIKAKFNRQWDPESMALLDGDAYPLWDKKLYSLRVDSIRNSQYIICGAADSDTADDLAFALAHLEFSWLPPSLCVELGNAMIAYSKGDI